MARGKHATHAAATKAREDAISEAEIGRRTITKLTKENAELRATLESERKASADRTRALIKQLNEVTSPVIVGLRQELAASLHREHHVEGFAEGLKDGIGDVRPKNRSQSRSLTKRAQHKFALHMEEARE